MSDFRTDFRVRVRQPEERSERGSSEESRRQAFWQPFLQVFERDDQDRPLDADVFENALRRRLPDRLHSGLANLFQGRGERGEPLGPALPIVFTVTSIGYSSLDLGINLEPLSKAVEIFDRNFDYFRAALEGFVPQAINDTILWAPSPHGMSRPAEKEAVVNRLQTSIEYQPDLVAAFARTPPEVAERKMTTADKARWAWIAANTSLLVPTALAAIYLYVVHQDLQESEKMRPTEYHSIIDQQTKLLSTCGTLLSQSVDRSLRSKTNTKPNQP